MNTTEILLNIDLAAATSALVMIGMIAVPNTDRIRAFWRVLTRRRVVRARNAVSWRATEPGLNLRASD
jgi:hypothetical protein